MKNNYLKFIMEKNKELYNNTDSWVNLPMQIIDDIDSKTYDMLFEYGWPFTLEESIKKIKEIEKFKCFLYKKEVYYFFWFTIKRKVKYMSWVMNEYIHFNINEHDLSDLLIYWFIDLLIKIYRR